MVVFSHLAQDIEAHMPLGVDIWMVYFGHTGHFRWLEVVLRRYLEPEHE